MYKLTQNNTQVVILSSLSSCFRYIGLKLTIEQALAAGYKIEKVRL